MSPSEASEIIDFLDGTTAVANLLGIKAPSVHEWRERGIPPDRLIRLAPILESRQGSRWSRRSLFPQEYARIWPELVSQRRRRLAAEAREG